MRTPLVLAAAGAATSAAAAGLYQFVVRPWYEQWGVDPDEETRALAGDGLIAEPSAGETRGITIEAPAAAIWPWLVQMGYGRGGWYSYDMLDQRGHSADRIVPELQAIAVGGVVPTHPGGGFQVAEIEPDRALVLYLDDEIVEQQRTEAEGRSDLGTTPPGVAVSGAMLATQPRRFRASWAFVLDPLDGTRTRLIERFRIEYPEGEGMARLTGPFIGFGVFVMMRRQMLGLQERAERLVAEGAVPSGELPVPVGHEELVPA